MIDEDVIAEHPPNQPALWMSCAVITPKPKSDGEIRVTLDARNVNHNPIFQLANSTSRRHTSKAI